jgi:hypothetical protein
MIKVLGTGIWIAIVALVAVYFSVQMAMAPKVDEELVARRATEETVKLELTSLPVVKNGKVEGYFLTRLSFVVNKVKMAEIHIPIDVLVTDELFTSLVGDHMIDISSHQDFDVEAFRNRIKEALNKRLGDEVVYDVLVQQIDYLSKDDLRSNVGQKNQDITGGHSLIPTEGTAPEQDSHTAPAH